jgi:hypothetical protein
MPCDDINSECRLAILLINNLPTRYLTLEILSALQAQVGGAVGEEGQPARQKGRQCGGGRGCQPHQPCARQDAAVAARPAGDVFSVNIDRVSSKASGLPTDVIIL